MTDIEYKTHFSLWAILAAPLIASTNLTTMTASTRAILGNTEVIAVDQDVLGEEGRRIWKAGESEIWSKPLSGGDMAVGFFNRSDGTATIPVTWSQLGFSETPRVRNLWAHKDLGRISSGYIAVVRTHGVVLLRLAP
jgi:alpha-galactosidase